MEGDGGFYPLPLVFTEAPRRFLDGGAPRRGRWLEQGFGAFAEERTERVRLLVRC